MRRSRRRRPTGRPDHRTHLGIEARARLAEEPPVVPVQLDERPHAPLAESVCARLMALMVVVAAAVVAVASFWRALPAERGP